MATITTTRDTFNVTAAKTPAVAPHSPWHSPVPYLFGGLAAMLGLIAFALLILACSYWRLSGYLDGGSDNSDRDLEAGEGKGEETKKAPQIMEEKFLVIMAGEVKPTFLATPISSRQSSFGDHSCSNKSCCSEKSDKLEGAEEGVKQGSTDDDQVQTRTMDSHETSDQTQ